MNPLIQLKKTTPLFSSSVAALLRAFCQERRRRSRHQTEAIPGFNTAEGNNALQNLTTGVGNTAVGWFSLFSEHYRQLEHGHRRWDALSSTPGDNNTAIGALALLFNTTGSYNTADGAFALFNNTTGSGNTGTGSRRSSPIRRCQQHGLRLQRSTTTPAAA